MTHRRLHRVGRRGALGIAAAGTAGLLSAAAVAGTPATTIYLNSADGPDISQASCVEMGGCGPMVKSPIAMTAGQSYTIRVTGTVSAWNYWKEPCGSPEARPEYPSGLKITPTGDDAVFRFAIHGHDPSGRCDKTPYRSGLFQINLGNGWYAPTALGNPTRPSGDRGGDQHPYSFRVTGLGMAPKFRYVDYHPSDNDGKFKIVISAEP